MPIPEGSFSAYMLASNPGWIYSLTCYIDLCTIAILHSDDPLNHPCLRQLERDLDVQHTCGYIRLLRTGAPPPRSKLRPESKASCGVKKTEEDKAKNAEISSFLEDLRELGIGQSQTPPNDPPETQNGTATDEESHSNLENGIETLSPVEKKIASEWVPLELSFGIPLFSDDDNKAVCDKVCVSRVRVLVCDKAQDCTL